MTAAPHLVPHLALAGAATGLVAALALALRPCVPDAVLRHRLMRVALAAACLLPLAQAAAVALPRPTPVELPAVPILAHPFPSSSGSHAARAAAPPSSRETPAAARARPRMPRPTPEQARAAIGAYVLGLLLAAAHAVARIARSVALVRRARPVTDPATLAIFDRAKSDAGVRRRVALLRSDRVRSPAAWSLRRSAVVLPAGALELDPEALRGILYHELVHIRRHDAQASLAWLAIATALWFQPLLWIFGRAMKRDAESSCDALVVRATRAPRTYAHALLHFCGPHAPRHPAHAAMFASGAADATRRRIAMLASAQRPAGRVLSVASLAAALTLAAGALTAHAAASTRLGVAPPDAPGAAIEILAPGPDRDPRTILEMLLMSRGLPPEHLDGIGGTGTLTEAETVLSARQARADGGTLTSDAMLLSLPEGSHLRAIAEGDAVRLEPMERGARIILPNGRLRILDATGVQRVIVAAPAGATLTLETTPDAGEFAFSAAAAGADGRPVAMTAAFDAATGAPPEGADPAPGQTTWRFLTPAPGEDEPYRFKMQWHHNLGRVSGTPED